MNTLIITKGFLMFFMAMIARATDQKKDTGPDFNKLKCFIIEELYNKLGAQCQIMKNHNELIHSGIMKTISLQDIKLAEKYIELQEKFSNKNQNNDSPSYTVFFPATPTAANYNVTYTFRNDPSYSVMITSNDVNDFIGSIQNNITTKEDEKQKEQGNEEKEIEQLLKNPAIKDVSLKALIFSKFLEVEKKQIVIHRMFDKLIKDLMLNLCGAVRSIDLQNLALQLGSVSSGLVKEAEFVRDCSIFNSCPVFNKQVEPKETENGEKKKNYKYWWYLKKNYCAECKKGREINATKHNGRQLQPLFGRLAGFNNKKLQFVPECLKICDCDMVIGRHIHGDTLQDYIRYFLNKDYLQNLGKQVMGGNLQNINLLNPFPGVNVSGQTSTFGSSPTSAPTRAPASSNDGMDMIKLLIAINSQQSEVSKEDKILKELSQISQKLGNQQLSPCQGQSQLLQQIMPCTHTSPQTQITNIDPSVSNVAAATLLTQMMGLLQNQVKSSQASTPTKAPTSTIHLGFSMA